MDPATKKNTWRSKDAALELGISPSEVSESIQRSLAARLLRDNPLQVNRLALHEFLLFGLKYAFPARLGSIGHGLPTAFSAPAFQGKIVSDIQYVWPLVNGPESGIVLTPLYPNLAQAAARHPEFYAAMAAPEMIRLGKPREVSLAKHHLDNLFGKHAEPHRQPAQA